MPKTVDLNRLLSGLVAQEPGAEADTLAYLEDLRGREMRVAEVADLARAIAQSGQVLRWDDTPLAAAVRLDQPSTGGLGNKTPLIVPPIVASAGVAVPKMSTRGRISGTIDQLEAVGYNPVLPMEGYKRRVCDLGISNIGQTDELAPADERLMALRRREDVDLMDHAGLVVSSILGKKVAVGCTHVVVDLKAGPGSKFWKSGDHWLAGYERDLQGARLFVQVGEQLGLQVSVVVSNNDSPQGRTIGSSLALREAVEVLSGDGVEDLRDLCVFLAGASFYLAGATPDLDSGRTLAQRQITSKAALKKFREQLQAHGASVGFMEDPQLLPLAPIRLDVSAPTSGYVARLDVVRATRAARSVICDGGRGKHLDTGIVLTRVPGDLVQAGESVAQVYCRKEAQGGEAAQELAGAFVIQPEPPTLPPAVLAYLTPETEAIYWRPNLT